jgi:hypothetical protein
MSAASVVEAIITLAPLIEKVAGYLDGEHDELPDVPAALKSAIELKRFQARAKKPPPLPKR